MATDTDGQSDGRPPRRRRQPLSVLPGGLHGAFQIAWALGLTLPLAAKVEDLVGRPQAGAALAVIEVSAIWGVVAGLVWTIRVLALSSCGTWGAGVRTRARNAGHRRIG